MKLPSVAVAGVFSDSITIHTTGTSEHTKMTMIASDQSADLCFARWLILRSASPVLRRRRTP